jgi:uncharacterized membrane protein
VYFDALGDAWTIVKRDVGTWAALVLVAIVLAFIVALPFQVVSAVLTDSFNPQRPNPFDIGPLLIGSALNLVGSVVGFPVYAGLFFAAIKQIRGEQIAINDLFGGFSHFVPLAVFGFLLHLLWLIGCLLCIFPGVYALGVLSPGVLLIMDRGYGPVKAISEGMRVLGSQAWMLGLFAIFSYIAMSILGTLMCCIGLLVTMPVLVVAVALHYHYFWPSAPQQQQQIMSDVSV